MSEKNNKINRLQLLLTEDCNLRCEYCYIKKRKTELPLDLGKKAIDLWLETYQPDYQHILEFFGGEPFLKFDLMQTLVHYANAKAKIQNKAIQFLSFTNGTLLTEKVIAFLKKTPNFYMTISCDGVQEAQDRHRKTVDGKGSFGVLEEKFKMLAHDLPHNRQIKIHAVLTPDNVHALHQSQQYFARNYNGAFNFVYNFAYDMEWKQADYLTFQNQISKIIETEKKRLINQEKCKDKIIFALIRKIIMKEKSLRACHLCRPFGMTVNTEGEMFLCYRFESFLKDPKFKDFKKDYWLGNIKEYDRLDLTEWQENKNKVAAYMQANQFEECKTCKNEKYCSWMKCPWNNYVIHRSFFKLNTQMCKMLDHFLEPVFEFMDWLKEYKYLYQYFTGFNYRKNYLDWLRTQPYYKNFNSLDIAIRFPMHDIIEVVETKKEKIYTFQSEGKVLLNFHLTPEIIEKANMEMRNRMDKKRTASPSLPIRQSKGKNLFLEALEKAKRKSPPPLDVEAGEKG